MRRLTKSRVFGLRISPAKAFATAGEDHSLIPTFVPRVPLLPRSWACFSNVAVFFSSSLTHVGIR